MEIKITAKFLKSLKPEAKRYDIHDTEVRGFTLRVHPTGKRFFYVRWWERRQWQWMKLGAHPALPPDKARKQAKLALADVARGVDPRRAKKLDKEHTLKSYLAEVYGPWVTENRRAGNNTLRRLEKAFPEFQRKRLGEITAWDLRKWKTERVKARKSKSAGNRDISCLRAALQFAVTNGQLTENPLKGFELPKQDRASTIHIVTPEEEIRLWKAFDERDETKREARDSYNEWLTDRGFDPLPSLRGVQYIDHVRPLVILLFNTGLRRGEAFKLSWQDVNLREGMLTVRAENAKSGRQRVIPLNRTALDTLRTWKEQTSGDGLVFPSPATGDQLDNVHKAWKNLTTAAEVTGLRLHDLRHTFASRALAAGADIAVVKELLGHQQIATTAIYLHPSKEDKRKAVERLTPPASNVVPLVAERA